MKKILLMVLILMISTMGTTFAYSDESNADAQKVIDSIKEIRYNVEAGVNFQDYSSLVSKAIVNFNKYVNKYPNADRDGKLGAAIKTLLTDYDAARTVWNGAIFNNVESLSSDIINSLINTRPPLKDKLQPLNNPQDRIYYEKILHALWSVAADDEKSLTNITARP